jgi:hypothetical protein
LIPFVSLHFRERRSLAMTKPSHLQALESWQWPADAGSSLLEYLRDQKADRAERLAAAELAGDLVVMNDEIARALLEIVSSDEEPSEMRRSAAISFGPALEEADLDCDLMELDDELGPAVSPAVFDEVRRRLRRLFLDASVPKEVRRGILEASVRAAENWHEPAIRQAFESGDRDWLLTATFCAQFVRGFEREILYSLDSEDEDIEREAVQAAGTWGLKRAWRHVASILREGADKELLLAAIEAAPALDGERASTLLADVADSPEWAEDEDVQSAIHEALAMCDEFDELDDEDDEEDEDAPY